MVLVERSKFGLNELLGPSATRWNCHDYWFVLRFSNCVPGALVSSVNFPLRTNSVGAAAALLSDMNIEFGIAVAKLLAMAGSNLICVIVTKWRILRSLS